MTRCPSADELAAYARHELDPLTQGIVETHVGACERCRLGTLLLDGPNIPLKAGDPMTDSEFTDGHLEPEDVYGFIEKSLSARRSREVQDHLDRCAECVRYVATVLAAEAPPTGEEDAVLSRSPDSSARDLLARLRPRIVATSPPSHRLPHRTARLTWAKVLPVAAGIVGFALFSWWAYATVISPLRSRNLIAQATTDWIVLRQGTGRLPLRYVPGFQRGHATRSGFDSADSDEQALEISIESRLRRAIELAPRDARARTALGLFLLDAARLDEAETLLREALELDPDSVEALNGLSAIYYDRSLRQPSQAEELRQEGLTLLRRALTIDEHNLMVLYNLAVFYQEDGLPQTARRAWLAYTSHDATSEWAAVAQENLKLLGFR
jgi:cytochrome c-type biogenesis protein CcmH/NrfG